jgi:flagellar protein FlaJ
MAQAYRKAALTVFGDLADRLTGSFEHLRPQLMGSGLGILLRTWISVMVFSAAISFIAALVLVGFIGIFLMLEFTLFAFSIVTIPVVAAVAVFSAFYYYPIERARRLQKDIETDLPFALAHMHAIASSGVPPESIFELLTDFKEYKGISVQSRMIVRNIKIFGMSSVNAMKDTAEKTPSPDFRQILSGMSSTMERGGDLVEYLKEMTDKSLFDYRIKREKFLKTLSTYADIYTALLVAAPLMLIAILGIMSIVGGEVLGLTVQQAMDIITWAILPVLNIAFLSFIHMTYPKV